MSSELFETRDEDYRQIYAEAKRKLSEQLPRCLGELQKKLAREISRNLEEARILIREMEDEVQKAPPSFRSQMMTKIRTYKRDLDQLSEDLKRVMSKDALRVTFGFTEEDEIERIDYSQRTQLLQGTNSLIQASDSLARSQLVAAESSQIGHDIIEELGTQRESLIRSKNRLTETAENLSKSRRILNRLSRSVLTNKLLLVIIILIELGILGGVLYWKISSRK